MDCREIGQYLSPYMDGESSPEEYHIVQSHLKECQVCRQEYDELMTLGTVLKQLGTEIIPAPDGFKDAVMQQILAENRPLSIWERTNKVMGRWKVAVTAVAAALLIALASLGINLLPASQVAHNDTAKHHTVVVADKGNSNGNKTSANDSVDNPAAAPSASQGAKDNANSSALAPLTENKVINKDANSYPVFLNTERVIKTTMLEVRVSDSNTALEQAMIMAANAGASTQNLGQQVNENGTCSVVKITAARSAASGLISSLSSLGTVTGQDVDKKDITSQFSQTLSKYQSLVAERETTSDAGQQAQLDQQINKLEAQLNSLQANAQKETIVLWLEK